MDRWIQRTVGAVALLPLIGCGLFLAGHAQSSAFLTALGLSSAQFSSSFEGLALGGFVILLVRGVSPVLYLICTVVFISLLVMLASVVLRKRDIRRQIDLDRALKESSPSTSTRADRLERVADDLYTMAVVAIAALLVVITLLTLPEKAGRASADQFKRDAAAGARSTSEIFVKGASESRIGVLSACNDSQCAYWFEDHAEIFNQADLDRVVTRPASRKNK